VELDHLKLPLLIEQFGVQPMTAKQMKLKPPELKVVFDSSILYTGSASDLLNRDVIQLIREHSNHPDLILTWYLPDIVVHERQFQMLKKGQELLPTIQKLEKLLGHNLNITESVIESRVNEAVERQSQEYNLQRFSLVIDKVDWNRMILDAAYRHPPFEYSEKEKGFRDALILEAFMQIVADSPATPKICRIALVTGDKLLGEAAKSRTSSSANVRILSTNEELKGLINTLVSEISEEFVAKIQEQAKQYFFSPGEKTTLYYREDVATKIREKYNNELLALPKGADRRENGTWYILPPRFVKKEGQRVYWTSRISLEAKAYANTRASTFRSPGFYVNAEGELELSTDQNNIIGSGFIVGPSQIQLGGLTYQAGQQVTNESPYLLSPSPITFPALPESGTLVMSGKIIFEITWSVLVKTNQKFNAPKIEDIRFVETSWE